MKALKEEGMCPKCTHYQTCQKPCYPVQRILSEKYEPYEVAGVLYPAHGHIQMSHMFSRGSKDGDGRPNREGEQILSNDRGKPFKEFNPNLVKTGIFIQRFFFKQPFKDIAVMYDFSVDGARCHYSKALEKILKVMKLLDEDGRKENSKKHYKKVFRKNAEDIPKTKKCYILAKVFGFSPKEISEMFGDTPSEHISAYIHHYHKRIEAKKYPKPQRWYILHNAFDFSYSEIAAIENNSSSTKTNQYKVRNCITNYEQGLKRKNIIFLEV
jgi:hypothetical protein